MGKFVEGDPGSHRNRWSCCVILALGRIEEEQVKKEPLDLPHRGVVVDWEFRRSLFAWLNFDGSADGASSFELGVELENASCELARMKVLSASDSAAFRVAKE